MADPYDSIKIAVDANRQAAATFLVGRLQDDETLGAGELQADWVTQGDFDCPCSETLNIVEETHTDATVGISLKGWVVQCPGCDKIFVQDIFFG